jgi:hypothetical protein
LDRVGWPFPLLPINTGGESEIEGVGGGGKISKKDKEKRVKQKGKRRDFGEVDRSFEREIK